MIRLGRLTLPTLATGEIKRELIYGDTDDNDYHTVPDDDVPDIPRKSRT